jgi:hypothetical protein
MIVVVQDLIGYLDLASVAMSFSLHYVHLEQSVTIANQWGLRLFPPEAKERQIKKLNMLGINSLALELDTMRRED